MLPANNGTRDLLPLIQADSEETILSEQESGGAPAAEDALPLFAPSPATHPMADLAPLEEDDAGAYASMPIKALPNSSAAFQVSTLAREDADHGQIAAPNPTLDMAIPKPLMVSAGRGAGAHSAQDDAPVHHGADDDIGKASQGPLQDPLNDDNDVGGTADIDDNVHRITVRQDAEVDQDASIIVHGYAGKVVARLHIDQDLLMDQDVDIDFKIDGDGRFSVLVDQDMRIDQDVDIDLKIFDVDGVLYVDLILKDRVAVEQDTTLDLKIGDGPYGGTVAIDQTLEMTQDVDINIDIEDDLEERYLVKVDIDVRQDVDADQDATVDITHQDGEIDMDVDAFQTAFVDQETIARIDFASL
jgi:hypothetical protein